MSDSDTVISVENLSKSYLIGHDGPKESYHSLRDTIARHGKNYARKAMDMARGKQVIQGDSVEEFWALKDVSFEVKRGEVLGIIGRNGAGKSTLLKVLSRITEPTSGRVVLNGRVASLLEVGTGFHPELTGRENIFLNGAILGMSKLEIKKKFDEIVDFAGVEKFLDTPVKRYSSGMYVRLAFAVAAHLEPEILIIDEVLAVGDAEFQKKCLGKMQDVAKGGRTVIFVSHQMDAITKLTNRCALLCGGKLVADSSTKEVMISYKNLVKPKESGEQSEVRMIQSVSIQSETPSGVLQTMSSAVIKIKLRGFVSALAKTYVFSIYTKESTRLIHGSFMPQSHDGNEVSCQIKSLPLTEGEYYINVAILESEKTVEHLEFAALMYVNPARFHESLRSKTNTKFPIFTEQVWSLNKI